MKRVTFTIDCQTYEKLKSIAQEERRFVSKQVLYWVRQCIREYERQ